MLKKFITILAALLISANLANAAPDSKGTDFWLAFPGQLSFQQLTLFIAGDVSTSGNVSISGLSFSQNFNVTPGQVTVVNLPVNAQLSGTDGVENLGIHVTAQNEVTVYGLNRASATTDAYLGLPKDILGTEYIVLGYKNVGVINGTEFVVAASADNTTVTIVPSVTTGSRLVGVPYNIILNQGQAYQLRNTGAAPNDLSGTIVTADKPIAVFGGHQCANIPAGFDACDHIVEQLPPTETWGKSFVTVPLATRENGDTFRFLASTDGTNVTVNGTLVAALNRGQIHERIINSSAVITSDKPILVAQYSNSCSFDPAPNCAAADGDPFMMLIPPFEQFLGQYTVSTPDAASSPTVQFPANFINVVAPTAAVGAITLDGSAIPSASFTPIGSSGFSGAEVPLSQGSHNLSGPLPFGAFIYGFGSFDSYGYPGGLSLAPVARVTNLSLAPKTATNPVGTQHCLVATVTDQNNEPLEGVRVDFNVSGANTTGGFANTQANGQAQFCYTGTNPGLDTIEASVGDISDTATKNWTDEGNTPPVADPQSVRTSQNTPITITLSGSDPDGAPLTFHIVTQPDHGTLSNPVPLSKPQLSKARRQLKARLQKERKIPGTRGYGLKLKELAAIVELTSFNKTTYTPDPNYHGPDSFTFKVNDGEADSAPATVNITVADPPVIQDLSFARRTSSTPGYSTPGIAALLLLNVDGNDSVSMTISSIKAMNLPKACGPNVLPSDEVTIAPPAIIETIPVDPAASQGEIKVLEIGPAGMGVAADNGCQVTLKLLTGFTIHASANPSLTFVTLEPLCIDSDGGAVYSCAPSVPQTLAGQSRTSKAGTKIAPPAMR